MKQPRTATPGKDQMQGAYLGPEYSDEQIEAELTRLGAVFTAERCLHGDQRNSRWLASEKVVGWFNGRMEFGPRSLGARSILGDPRSPRMQAQMNIKIKFREGFRPFAPSVLRERVHDYFELDTDSPYMLLVAPVKPSRRKPTTEKDAVGYRQAQCAAFGYPGRHAHRLFRARADRHGTLTRPITRCSPHSSSHRMCRAGEHLVQCAGRADRVLARRRVSLLHAHRHGPAGAGLVSRAQDGSTGLEGVQGMAAGIPARLTAAEGRKFAFTVAAAFLVLAALLWWRGRLLRPYSARLG